MPTEGDLYCGQAPQNGLKTKYAARMRVSTGACEVGFWSCGSASTSRVKLADAAATLHMDTYPTLPLDFHVNVNLRPHGVHVRTHPYSSGSSGSSGHKRAEGNVYPSGYWASIITRCNRVLEICMHVSPKT